MLLSGSAALAQAAVSSDHATWIRKVQQHLLDQVSKAQPATRAVFQKAKSYGMTGEISVAISFVVARNGTIESTKVAKSSGNFEIDSIAEQLIARAGPVPAIPAAIADQVQALTLPVVFKELPADKSKK
jgi:TonB family protein